MIDAYDGKANWKAADLADPAEWMIQLSPAQIGDLDNALRSAKAQGVTIDKLTKASFPLEVVNKLVPEIQDRLENGRGIVVLRGLPAERYAREDLRLMYWGLGLYLGTAVTQSSKGDLLGDVRDFGQAVLSSTGRGYMSRQHLGFHSDMADVVALMVLRAAKSGGRSMICSSIAVRNEIAARRPDLLEVMYQPFYWSWKGQEAPGEAPYYLQPIYTEHKRKFASRNIFSHQIAAYEYFKELGPMPPRLQEAWELANMLANDDTFHFGMMFEPGDIQLLNNHVTHHSRTEFDDFEEEDRKRHLLRMWLSMPNTRELSPLMSAIYRDQTAGAVRGGFPSRTGRVAYSTQVALSD